MATHLYFVLCWMRVLTRTSLQRAPLMGCARAGHADACRLLLARGARVADVNEFGETAVDVAQNAGHLAMVTLLNTHDEQKEGRDQEEGREY